MTKKDYIAIARAVSSTTKDYLGKTDVDPQAMMADLTWELADVMQADNPKFDRARFLAACGVQS